MQLRSLCVLSSTPARLILCAFLLGLSANSSFAAPKRHTATVRAVEKNADAIVNIHGQKTVPASEDASPTDQPTRVNGMGTGVVIDPRGYILTNFHVVDGVKKIQVTLANGQTYVATLLSHDSKTDLAVIRVHAGKESLPVITIGTSNDLLPGETVIAVGNAYGYEHTVTRGIISALHRTVPVSGSQTYRDLIQVDASINPGNSGGPLLNIEGEMIGINVAVRQGAQGIGFAIPVDTALNIAAELCSTTRLDKTWHGIVPVAEQGDGHPTVAVGELEEGSPAQQAGLKPGDVLVQVNRRTVDRPLDVETALLEHRAGDEVQVSILRDQQPQTLSFSLATASGNRGAIESDDSVWQSIGMRLEPMSERQFQQLQTRFHGGMKVVAVRTNSPASKQGIHQGDILVGMHDRETLNLDNIQWILSHVDTDGKPVKFLYLHGSEVRAGYLPATILR